MFTLLNDLRDYNPTSSDKVSKKKETLTNADMLYDSRNKITEAFEFFLLRMNLKKKKQLRLIKHYQNG